MKIDFNAFKSRLGRRILSTFIASATLPVVVLAVVSLYQVADQLEKQADHRLRWAAKSHGLSIYEHLLFCEDELKLLDRNTGGSTAQQQEKFDAIGRWYPGGRYETILGEPIPMIRLTSKAQAHLETGESLLVAGSKKTGAILLVRRFEAGVDSPGLLFGRVSGAYLWGLDKGNNLPPLTEVAIHTSDGRLLHHSFLSKASPASSTSGFHDKAGGQTMRIRLDDTTYFAADWHLFMKPKFGTESWRLSVFQPEAHVLAPIARFKTIFILVVILALLMVLVLSLFNLRRSLGPIAALKSGLLRIADKDFNHRVRVVSKDEFQDLAQGFNRMSRQLGTQFHFLSTQAKIDQATLSAKDFRHIAGLAIVSMLKGFSFNRVGISQVDLDDPDATMTYMGACSAPDLITSHPFHINAIDLDRFRPDLPWITVDDPAQLSRYVPIDDGPGIDVVSLFPMFVKDRLFAILFVVAPPTMPMTDEALSLTRQFADHLAMAWFNVDLIRDLKRLTLGSMQALARAVDAKSPWTAGHSARVTRFSLSIARHLGLAPERIRLMEQAALLHDIGKIGISSAILDKPGNLTDAEFETIRSHPVIGDRILSPIPAFKAVIPIVRQHHERWDGKGYPDGLYGDTIILEARIMAIADAYDAMISDRPYRQGMDQEHAMSIIASESGRQFDPAVVDAFLALMNEKSAMAA